MTRRSMALLVKPASEKVVLIALFLTLSFTFVGCAKSYPERPISLVWEVDIPGSSARVRTTNRGGADVSLSELGIGLLQMVYLDSSGQKIGEIDWSQIANPDGHLGLQLDHATKFGWATLERKIAYERGFTPTGSGGRAVYLDSVIRMVSRNGETRWEIPGPAQAHLFHADDSVIGCYGKDPAVLDGISGDASSSEYASQALQRYDESPTRVMLLDSETGSIQAQFDLPGGGSYTPTALVSNEGFHSGSMVLSIEYEGGSAPVLGFRLSSVDDGSTVRAVDLREVLPNAHVATMTYSSAGMLATSGEGATSVLDFEGRILRTLTPKRAQESDSGVQPVWSSDEGLVMVKSVQTSSYSTGANSAARLLMAVTLFDENGGVLHYQRDLKNMFVSARDQSRVFAVAESSRIGEDFLYVFDMGKDGVTVSRARIPVFDSYAVSPSGEFVVTVRKASEGQVHLSMYRLGAL